MTQHTHGAAAREGSAAPRIDVLHAENASSGYDKNMRMIGDLRAAISALHAVPMRAARRAEIADLSGECGRSVYNETIDLLDALISAARETREQVVDLRAHDHEWDDTGYCCICGADGAA